MSVLRRRSRSAALLAVLLGLLASAAPASAAGPAEPADLLPDLRMLPATEFHVRWENGAKLLRFSTTFVNVGKGPFEVRGRRECSSLTTCPRMLVRQRFLRADGTWRHEQTTAHMKLEVGDGHHHWHVIGMQRFELFDLDAPKGGEPRAGAKFGFCFFDVRAYRPDLPDAPTSRRYVEAGEAPNNGCGSSADLTNRMGLSVGWRDIYPWDFAGQWIDITGVPDGEYLLCLTADPKDRFDELRDHNNEAWQKLRLKGTKVTILAASKHACADQLPPAEPEPAP